MQLNSTSTLAEHAEPFACSTHFLLSLQAELQAVLELAHFRHRHSLLLFAVAFATSFLAWFLVWHCNRLAQFRWWWFLDLLEPLHHPFTQLLSSTPAWACPHVVDPCRFRDTFAYQYDSDTLLPACAQVLFGIWQELSRRARWTRNNRDSFHSLHD